jgi:DNA-binding SARP family transcriptional activator
MRSHTGIKIYLLGKVRIEVFGQERSLPYRQVRYLLAYLAMERQMVSRSLLTQMLWPGVGADTAASRLRQALHTLRSSVDINEPLIAASRLEVGLHPKTKICSDIHAIREHVGKGNVYALRKNLLSSPTQFLAEEKPDGLRWNAWVKRHRDEFGQLLDTAFHLILQSDEESNSTDALLDWAVRWARWRPLADAPQCAMAKLLLKAGRPHEAAQQLAIYRKELAERMGRKPEPECLELHNRAQFLCQGQDRRKQGGHGQGGLTAMASPAGSFHRYFVWILAMGPQNGGVEDGLGEVDEHLNLCLDMATKIARDYGGTSSVTARGWIEIRFGLGNELDNFVQAVGAAFALRQAVHQGHSPYIGLHCGKLMVDTMFSIFIGDVGEKASSVARLDPSGQGVVLSAEAWAILRNHRQIQATVKKLGNPAHPAYRLESYQTYLAPPSRTRFVGRKKELAMIRTQAGQVLDAGSGQMIWVLGEAGSGKSRLVMEAGAIIPGEMAKVVYRCSFQQQRTLLYPAANLVREFFALVGATRAVGAQRLREGLAHFDVVDPEIVRIWTVWLGFADQETPAGSAAVGDKETLMESLLDILPRFLSYDPRLLVIEDLHWADMGSMELIARFLQVLANLPVLLLLTTRHRLPTLEGIASNESFLDIGPLTQAAGLAMLRSIHGEAREDDLAIIERSAGVPLYLEALASDVLPKATSDLGVADIPAPPADLLSILDTTVSIGHPYLDVLQAAAIIGEAFTQGCMLALLPGKTAAEFAEASAFLIKHRIWERRQVGMVFRHMLVRDAVYHGTPVCRRKHLHAAAAEYFSVIEQGVDPAYLGWHYLHADMRVAAKRSLDLGVVRQSTALYREIGQIVPGLPAEERQPWPLLKLL